MQTRGQVSRGDGAAPTAARTRYPPAMCADGGRGRRWSHLTSRLTSTPGTWALVALQLGAFAWVAFWLEPTPPGPFASVGVESLLRAGALERGRVQGGEWWRLLAGAFLHASWLHLAMNAALGAGWCRAVERTLGTARFLGLWLGSALAASAASLLLQDAVAVGASGAIFGMVGAELAFHRRALPGWRAFLESRATRLVAASLAVWALVALLAGLRIDHAAHTGGLLFGAAGAWAATRPTPRRLDLAWLLLALLVGCAAAAWPRAGLSRMGALELERDLHRALQREDRTAAAALLARAGRAGLAGDDWTYYQAQLEAQEGQLEAALERLRPLVDALGPLRDEARRARAGIARLLGYRLYTGDGRPKDPEAGLRWLVEACQLGEATACRDAARIVGGPEQGP